MTTTSVVICAYTQRRWHQLCGAVASVEEQDQPPGQIVIVIDHEPELLRRSLEQWPAHTVVPNAGRRGLSGARNTGVDAATGDVIAFLDDDAVAEADWLGRLCVHFADPSVAGVGGRVVPEWAAEPPGWLPAEFRWVVGCSYTGQPEELSEVRNPIGANMAFRRSAFDAVGGFRDHIGRVGTMPLGCEETEFSIRVGATGGRVLYDPDAVVHHHVPSERTNSRYFLRRCWAEGLSKAAVTDLAGADRGLASERRYVTATLPRGVAAGVRDAVRGPHRRDAAGRVAAIVGGTALTAAGYVRGKAARA